MRVFLSLAIFTLIVFEVIAQDHSNQVFHTFNATRVINAQSTETVKEGYLDIRISHRFGDIIRDWKIENSWENFFGFEEASDILFGFEYGLKSNLTLGISRTKGGADFRQLMHGMVKYRPLTQTEDNLIPISLALVGTASISTMKASAFNPYNPVLSSFASAENQSEGQKFSNRWRYAFELHLARKFGKVFSLQISPIMVWRNLVKRGEPNALFSCNLATRIQISKSMAFLLDANFPFSKSYWQKNNTYYFPLGIGFEFETAGHIFQINFTNSKGIVSTDYISDTSSDWLSGEFRLGFTISRVVKLKKVVKPQKMKEDVEKK